MKTRFGEQKGSLALEQVLFIAAIVAMSVGLYSFYGKLNSYFSNFEIPATGSQSGAN